MAINLSHSQMSSLQQWHCEGKYKLQAARIKIALLVRLGYSYDEIAQVLPMSAKECKIQHEKNKIYGF